MISYHLIIYGLLLKLGASTSDDLFKLRSKKLQVESRIIGGQEVEDIKSYRFMAQLLTNIVKVRAGKVDVQREMCGATILSTTKILTAAHCLNDVVQDTMCVFAGTVKSKFDEFPLTCELKIKKYDIHPLYKKSDPVNKCYMRYDAAVVELVKPLRFGETIGSVQLAKAADIRQDLTSTETSKLIAEGANCTILGWGVDNDRVSPATYPKNLKVNQIPLVDYTTCLSYSNESKYPYPNKGICTDNTQICSMDPQMKNSICDGDSGGPIICEGKQIGITSWSSEDSPCGTQPQLYTRVDVIVDWINSVFSSGN